MSEAPPVDKDAKADPLQSMKDAFDSAIAKSAEITTLTTAKKADLDAAKQRPQN